MNKTNDFMTDKTEGMLETQEITKFVDNVQPDEYEKPMMSKDDAWLRMAEDLRLHDIHAILRRPVNVFEGEFINPGFANVKLKFPDIIFNQSDNVVSKLNYFTYFRANVKAKLIFNATPFMSGKYWMYFAPFDSVSNRGSRPNDLSNSTGFPGIEIDLASGAPVEIKIPYCSPLSHYNLVDTHSNMGELYVVPLNGIQTEMSTVPTGSGAPFTIFAWFEDIELSMPTSLPVKLPSELTNDEGEETEIFQAHVSEEAAATEGPKISGVLNSVASTASKIGSFFPTLDSYVRPVEWVSRAVGGVAETLGWNKPTNLDRNMPYINVPAKGYTNMSGIDLSSKLSAAPDNGLTYDGGLFSTDVDEMDIGYVTKKSCIFASSVNWDTSIPVGRQIYQFPVSPGICPGTQSSLEPTTLAFVTSMFRYWRGAIKYRITVAKTAFHTGRLRITYHPGVYDTADTNRVNQNAYNWILDLSITSELEFEIPFVANVPWKETLVSSPSDTNNFLKEKFSTGHISIEVLTPLRAASTSVANNCPMNFWISGGDDFALAIPDFSLYVVTDPSSSNLTGLEKYTQGPFIRVANQENPEDEEEFQAQVFNLTTAATGHNEQMQDQASNTFPMPTMSLTKAEELTMGEKITSLRQLTRRFGITSEGFRFPYLSVDGDTYSFPGPVPLNNDDYLFNQLQIDPAYFGNDSLTTVPTIARVELPSGRNTQGLISTASYDAWQVYPNQCPLHYISYLYRFYRGGKRYKVATPSTNGVKKEIASQRQANETISATVSPFFNVTDSIVDDSTRPQEPLIVSRDWQVQENGGIAAPGVSTFTTTQFNTGFEHYNYTDLNGTLEFEVPYYAQTPISLVAEGLITDSEGPLIRRSRVFVRRSRDPRGMDRPIYNGFTNTAFATSRQSRTVGGGMRNAFGAYTLFEAAADDFTFGYLVGAPKIARLVTNP